MGTLSFTTSYSGVKPLLTSTPSRLRGRSLTCPAEDLTMNALPKYRFIVLAFAGDSTITSDLLDILLHFKNFCANTHID